MFCPIRKIECQNAFFSKGIIRKKKVLIISEEIAESPNAEIHYAEIPCYVNTRAYIHNYIHTYFLSVGHSLCALQ